MSAPTASPRILVVRLSSMGDVVLTTPLIRALRRRYPDTHLTALTRESYRSLLSYNPHLTNVEVWGAETSVTQMARRLREQRYTHLLDLQNSLRTRTLRAMTGGRWMTYSKRRWQRELLVRLKVDRYGDTVPEAVRFFEAARTLDVAPDDDPPTIGLGPDTPTRIDQWCRQHAVPSDVVALAPGAAHRTKRWPLHHWVTTAQTLIDRGQSVVIIGGTQERPAGTAIAQSVPGVIDACGAFSLLETAALLGRARVLLAGDTGVVHLASAMGTPMVVALGPTVTQFGFVPYRARVEVVQRSLPCRPCSPHGGAQCPLRHHACLDGLEPARTLAALDRVAA